MQSYSFDLATITSMKVLDFSPDDESKENNRQWFDSKFSFFMREGEVFNWNTNHVHRD